MQEKKEAIDTAEETSYITEAVDAINKQYAEDKNKHRQARNKRKAVKNKLKKKAVTKIDRRKAKLVPRLI